MLGKNEDIDNWLSVSWKMKKVSRKNGERYRYQYTVLEGQTVFSLWELLESETTSWGEKASPELLVSFQDRVERTEGSSVMCGWYGKTSGGEQTKEVVC